MKFSSLAPRVLAAFLPFGSTPSSLLALSFAPRTVFQSSFALPGRASPAMPRLVRETLTTTELAQPLTVVVSLQMRNFDQLQAALGAGQLPTRAQMEADFLPLQSDYDQTKAWLEAQGLTCTLVDGNHTNVFVRGSVSQMAAIFGVSFARLSTADGEFSSTQSAPSLPVEIAGPVLGIVGLQPEQMLHPPGGTSSSVEVPQVHATRAVPADILAAYGAPANYDGTGQTIAIIAGDEPTMSDVTSFYQVAGLTKTPPPFIVVPVNGGPLATDISNEVKMDVEWSSAIAPGAQVMLYATPTYLIPDFLAACTQIMNDGKAKIVSNSASAPENTLDLATLQASSQVLAQMAAAGITVLHGSGDHGSTGIPVYPSSDPNVTSLAGTTLSFDANWQVTDETVWPQTGSGVSQVFARPSWQTGPGVPTGTMRCVPDAASLSSTNTATGNIYSLVIADGRQIGDGGDSLTGPVWSGLVAIINQARAAAGLPTIGLLAPRLYPLIGTSCFKDITVGNNGAYSAGPGYDLCSGVGSPNVTALIAALTTSDPASISASPASQTIADGGTVVFTTAATGAPAPTYQWFHQGTAMPGATSSMLVLRASATTAGNYTCVATNPTGMATSQQAALTIASATDRSRLINLSVLTDVTTLAPMFTVGTVVSGGTGTKPILLRAVGPSLAPFGVTAYLADPTLDLYTGSSLVATDNDWGGSADLSQIMTQSGAFAFVGPTSKDSALYQPTLAPGAYTMQVSGVGGTTGTALAELYDATPRPIPIDAPRIINLSVLKRIAATETFTAGFAISGTTAETVLIRAIGPQLGLPPFNLSGMMPDPRLVLFNRASVAIAGNDNWGGDPQIKATADGVGAFTVTDPASKDAMLLITLPPGNYTAQVTDTAQTGGTAIVEVYEVP